MVTRARRGAVAPVVATCAAAGLAAGLAACLDPDYHCGATTDCDVGEAGRCEIDHRCTAYDPTCPTHRRYSDHAGPVSNTCFDDRIAPVNLCAAGQPPAIPATPATRDGCAAAVCDTVANCCTSWWSETCVQEAQLLCSDLRCDTRIAITAAAAPRSQAGMTELGATELWDLRYDGTQPYDAAHWTVTPHPRLASVLAWLAPAPGASEPRLVGSASDSSCALSFADAAVPIGAAIPDARCSSVSAVDFDRDGRATAMLGYIKSDGSTHLDVVKLDDPSSRTFGTLAGRLSWGALDNDAFPDGMAAAMTVNAVAYRQLQSVEAANRSRSLDQNTVTMMPNDFRISSPQPPPPAPPPAPAVRGFDWIDVNRDHQLDVVVFGSQVNIHLGQRVAGVGPSNVPRPILDCDPPQDSTSATCTAAAEAASAFAGAAFPERAGAALIVAGYPARTLYRVELAAGSGGASTITPTPMMTGCTGAACPPIIAVVVRDLDGDHQLDVVAIDAGLQVHVALGADPQQPLQPLPINHQLTTSLPLPIFEIRTSVAGAPR